MFSIIMSESRARVLKGFLQKSSRCRTNFTRIARLTPRIDYTCLLLELSELARPPVGRYLVPLHLLPQRRLGIVRPDAKVGGFPLISDTIRPVKLWDSAVL